MRFLYVIMDKVAGLYVGAVTEERAEPAAIRSFYSALGDARTILSQHPRDYELLRVASISDQGEVVADLQVVATGSVWVDTIQPKETA